jgi:chitin disaccharide deacetylase
MTLDRRLVVNADDFGLSAGINAGILRAHTEGIVTTTSLMVRGPAAADAAAAAAKHPALAVGLHVDLAEWVCADGEWRPAYEVVDTDDAAAVASELERQLVRFRELTGRDPTHLDSHQHVHREEPVRSIMGRRAKELRVALRHHGRVRYCGAFYGRGHGGAPLPEAITPDRLARLLADLPEGATELCCHPAASVDTNMAYGAERLHELESLCDQRVREAVERAGISLCTFAEALTR